MIRMHYRAWRRRDGMWCIAGSIPLTPGEPRYRRPRERPFFHAPTLQGVLNCPKLQLRRDKMARSRTWGQDS